jgi:hypothetical protein
VSKRIAFQVAQRARDEGLGRSLDNDAIQTAIEEFCWFPDYELAGSVPAISVGKTASRSSADCLAFRGSTQAQGAGPVTEVILATTYWAALPIRRDEESLRIWARRFQRKCVRPNAFRSLPRPTRKLALAGARTKPSSSNWFNLRRIVTRLAYSFGTAGKRVRTSFHSLKRGS